MPELEQHINKKGAGRKFRKGVIDSIIIRIIIDRQLRDNEKTTKEELFKAVNKYLEKVKEEKIKLRAFQYHLDSKRLNKSKKPTGLISRGIIKEVDGECRLNLEDSHSLIDIATVLTKDDKKGDLILRSIETAFLKCFNSYLGDSLSGWRRDIWHAKDGTTVNTVRIPIRQEKVDLGNPMEIWSKETIKMSMNRVDEIKGKTNLDYKISYVFFVMSNSRRVKESAMSRIEGPLHWFTAWDKSNEFTMYEGQMAFDMYKDIAFEFFDTVIREPLIDGTSSFNLFKSEERNIEYIEKFFNEIDWILYHLMSIAPFASLTRKNEAIDIVSKHLMKLTSLNF